MRTLVAVVVIYAVFAGTSLAANAPDSRLDAAASEIAGHPVSVWCETDQAEWSALEAQLGFSDSAGYAPYGGSVIYLSPIECETIRYYLGAVGAFPQTTEGDALLTLLHESTHANGVVDEHATDCRALSLVRQYAVSLLGVSPTVRQTNTRTMRRRVRIHHKWVVRKVVVRTTQVVPNPSLDLVQAEAQMAHSAKPAAYSAPC